MKAVLWGLDFCRRLAWKSVGQATSPTCAAGTQQQLDKWRVPDRVHKAGGQGWTIPWLPKTSTGQGLEAGESSRVWKFELVCDQSDLKLGERQERIVWSEWSIRIARRLEEPDCWPHTLTSHSVGISVGRSPLRSSPADLSWAGTLSAPPLNHCEQRCRPASEAGQEPVSVSWLSLAPALIRGWCPTASSAFGSASEHWEGHPQGRRSWGTDEVGFPVCYCCGHEWFYAFLERATPPCSQNEYQHLQVGRKAS